VTDVVAARDIGQGLLATIAPGQRLSALMQRELKFPAQLHPSRLCPFSSFTGARPDQLALELRKPSQNAQHEATVRGGCVGPSITKRAEPRLLFRNEGKRIQQVASAAGQTIELGDQEDIILLKCIENPLQLCPVRLSAAGHLPEDLVGPGLFQSGDLCRDALAIPGYPRRSRISCLTLRTYTMHTASPIRPGFAEVCIFCDLCRRWQLSAIGTTSPLLAAARRNLPRCNLVLKGRRIEAIKPALTRFGLWVHQKVDRCAGRFG
jgi:hypothetical protein